MAQYWLQTPIENAKEVVQRFIDSNPSLTYYTGKKVSYTLETEVIFYDLAVNGIGVTDPDVIYFGSLVIASTDTGIQIGVDDGLGHLIINFSNINNTNQIDSNLYPYIIFNRIFSSPDSTAYFVGYKFQIS